MPRGIGQLTRLTKLSTFVIGEDDSVSAGVGELGGLNQLRGFLTIEKLRNVRDAAVECEEAKLKQKERLQHLRLDWSYSSDDRMSTTADVNNNEMALEALDPHRFLKVLSIRSYMGVKVPSWLSSLAILVRVEFENCSNIKRLPCLDHLRYLESLSIKKLSNLEYIEGSGESSSFFPSLENLCLFRCPNLKGWDIDNAESLQFSCLSYLRVYGCPNLTSMPMNPSHKTLYSPSSSSFPVSLFLSRSPLEILEINANGDSNRISALQCNISLRELKISNLPNLASLPNLTTLHSLKITSSPYLVSLSNEPLCLSSLHSLSIYYCHQLLSLPDWMLNLPGLQSLDIWESPRLEEKYKDNMAPDWDKISHIPNILINWEWIQRNSSYLL